MIQIFKTSTIPIDFIESLRLAMNYDFITKSDIYEWALSSIKENDNYDSILIDITAGNDVDAREIDFAVKQITEGKLEVKNSKRILISFISRELFQNKITHKEAAAFLYKLYFDLDFEDFEKNRFYRFDYDILFNGFNAPEKLDQNYKDLENTIAPYLDLNFENYDEWNNINNKIDLLKASY